MTATHTPGPWHYAFEPRRRSGGTVAFIFEADGTKVAKLLTTYNTTAHSALPANVRLIASAPDLLAALQWALEQIEDDLDPDNQAALASAQAAIARATGKSV